MNIDASKFLDSSDFAAYANNNEGKITLELPETVVVPGDSAGVVLAQSTTILGSGDSMRALIVSDAYPNIHLPALSFLVPCLQDGAFKIYMNGSVVKSAGNQYTLQVVYPVTGDEMPHTYTNTVREITAKIRTFAPI